MIKDLPVVRVVAQEQFQELDALGLPARLQLAQDESQRVGLRGVGIPGDRDVMLVHPDYGLAAEIEELGLEEAVHGGPKGGCPRSPGGSRKQAHVEISRRDGEGERGRKLQADVE